MIPLVVDTNIIYSAIYNKNGIERQLLNFIIDNDEIQLFAPTIFWNEIIRNLSKKLNFQEETVNSILSQFDIIEISPKQYEPKIFEARSLIIHKNDVPFVACALFLNAPIWSGNVTHFQALDKSKKVIWFNSKRLNNYFKKNILKK
ncbi:MAG: PIN domain-containing protein [Promethearchaeota archaeon]